MSNDTQAALQPLLNVLKQLDNTGLPKPTSPGRAIAKAARQAGVFPIPNLAVSICEKKFQDAITKSQEEGMPDSDIRPMGKLAYCNAMPRPSGASNIREFIACVLYAMTVGIIPGPEGTRLLYGAQVAHAALTKRPKKRGKSSHTSTVATELTEAKSTT